MCASACAWVLFAVLHVARVAEAAMTRLGGTLVVAHLQVQLALMGTQLLFGEGALVLLGHLGAQSGASEFGMFLCLSKRIYINRKFNLLCRWALSQLLTMRPRA